MDEVTCRHCGATNNSDELRCARCNWRLHLAAPQAAPEPYPLGSDPITATATAPAFETFPGGAPQDADKDAAERPTFQGTLFRDPASSKVIPIPTLTPLRPQVRENPSYRPAPRSQQGRSRRKGDSQGALEFQAAPESGMGLHVDVIYCDAPVALPAHRAMAAIVDLSIVLVSLGAFLGIFFLAGGDMMLNRETIPLILGMAAVIAMFYRFLWCLGNGDSPGMRFAGLRLVDFDGRRPDREQRGLRQVAGLLSIFSAGLGLVWALVDEENLTWHDHISKTFPTPG